jgi:pimeloyl-ACP methyl ester carboxylesterase
VHAHATRFLGDVFVYILQRERGSVEQPGPIVSTVLDALQAAWDGRTKEDPRLVVVAHSMGGNIMYEILTHYLPGRGSEIRVDVLVTVGSQVGIFEEMKLFAASDPAIPRDPARDRVQKPAAVDRWLNVFDRNDVFSFAAGAVFDGVEDFSYSTGKGLLGAHGAYFALPSFHRRLEARLREVL